MRISCENPSSAEIIPSLRPTVCVWAALSTHFPATNTPKLTVTTSSTVSCDGFSIQHRVHCAATPTRSSPLQILLPQHPKTSDSLSSHGVMTGVSTAPAYFRLHSASHKPRETDAFT